MLKLGKTYMVLYGSIYIPPYMVESTESVGTSFLKVWIQSKMVNIDGNKIIRTLRQPPKSAGINVSGAPVQLRPKETSVNETKDNLN